MGPGLKAFHFLKLHRKFPEKRMLQRVLEGTLPYNQHWTFYQRQTEPL
jgi:hypothetical protein